MPTANDDPPQLDGGAATQANTFRAQLKSWVDKVDVLRREGRDCLVEMSAHGELGPLATDARARLEAWLDDLGALVESGEEAAAEMDPYLRNFDAESRRFEATTEEKIANREIRDDCA